MFSRVIIIDLCYISFYILIGHVRNLNVRTTLNDDIFVSWEEKTDLNYFQDKGYKCS